MIYPSEVPVSAFLPRPFDSEFPIAAVGGTPMTTMNALRFSYYSYYFFNRKK